MALHCGLNWAGCWVKYKEIWVSRMPLRMEEIIIYIYNIFRKINFKHFKLMEISENI